MSKAKALVIDDERDIRELLTITLGRMGLRVDTASNVAEAQAAPGRDALRAVLHRHAPAGRHRVRKSSS